MRQSFPEIVERLRKAELVLPAVFVDEQVASEGYVDYLSVAELIHRTRTNGHAEKD